MMTENLMMEGVRRGGDRQVLHERVRIHSQAAAGRLKSGASDNDLLDRIAADGFFGIDRASIEKMARPDAFTGLSTRQTEKFLIEDIDPILDSERTQIRSDVGEVRV